MGMKELANNPKSTVIDSVHQRGERTIVTFRDSPVLYAFKGIPPALAKQWVDSPSLGRFFSSEIRNKYLFEKM